MNRTEKKLVIIIKDLIDFLEQYGQKRWVSLLSRELFNYEQSELLSQREERISEQLEILKKIKEFFGGMGALNDVFLMIKGEKEKTILINKELNFKLEALYTVIDQLIACVGRED